MLQGTASNTTPETTVETVIRLLSQSSEEIRERIEETRSTQTPEVAVLFLMALGTNTESYARL